MIDWEKRRLRASALLAELRLKQQEKHNMKKQTTTQTETVTPVPQQEKYYQYKMDRVKMWKTVRKNTADSLLYILMVIAILIVVFLIIRGISFGVNAIIDWQDKKAARIDQIEKDAKDAQSKAIFFTATRIEDMATLERMKMDISDLKAKVLSPRIQFYEKPIDKWHPFTNNIIILTNRNPTLLTTNVMMFKNFDITNGPAW